MAYSCKHIYSAMKFFARILQNCGMDDNFVCCFILLQATILSKGEGGEEVL